MTTIQPVKHINLYKDEQYNSFPSVIVQHDGQYRVGFRQAPDRYTSYGGTTHLDPASKAVCLTSENGEDWSSTLSILYDDYFYGVQDPCLNVLSDGTIFVTLFMWKVAELQDVKGDKDYHHTVFQRYTGKAVGSYSIRSTDGGKSWDQPIPIGIKDMFIRGNCVELEDGSILAPLYGEKDGKSQVVIGRTNNKGRTWKSYASIPADEEYLFHEPNLYRTESGRLLLFIRSLKKKTGFSAKNQASPLFTAESNDNGKTWSQPTQHPFYSPSPFHLLRLTSGQVFMSYGYRYEPYGIRAVILDSECSDINNSEEFIIRDGFGFDIGYTSAVQLKDERILVTYYYFDEHERHRYIAGTICTLNGNTKEDIQFDTAR